MQSVVSLIADPGVASSIWPGPILLWRLIMKYFLSYSPPADPRRAVVVTSKSMCTKYWLTA